MGIYDYTISESVMGLIKGFINFYKKLKCLLKLRSTFIHPVIFASLVYTYNNIKCSYQNKVLVWFINIRYAYG